jgi:hypothetical protein
MERQSRVFADAPANSESFFRRAQKLDSRLACRQQAHAGSSGGSNKRGVEMATWSLCTRSMASSGSSQPIYINFENVLTVERHSGITTVTLVSGQIVVVDTMPETVIKTE